MTTNTRARHARWRERWAQQENERRARAYRASQAAWQREHDERRRLLAVAAQPPPSGGPDGWLRPKRGEVLYWGGGASLIEAPYQLALRPPHYREFSFQPTGPAQAIAGQPVDAGQVSVTSQRVVFFGRSRREWAYAKLTGMAHSPSGQTWLLVSNRKKLSGVSPPPEAVSDFRLSLALAMADLTGERAALIVHLEEQIGEHRRTMPQPPAPATPEQAPLSARLGRYGGPLAIVAASLLFLSLCAIGTALAGNDERPESIPAPVTTRADPPATRSPRLPVPPTEASTEPADEPVRAADTGRPEQAAGDCAAYADSDEWCVDGVGDYDCENGSGNGPNYAPPDVEVIEPGTDPFGLDRNNDGEACEDQAPAPAAPPPPPADDTDPAFDTCAEAIDNGYGPYYQGSDPEYDWYRDADGDGVVCES